MSAFLDGIERLFSPIDAWGEFRRGARPAAVTFILYDVHGTWKVPFVRRRPDLPDHPGQVALPGGGVRAGESAWQGWERVQRLSVDIAPRIQALLQQLASPPT